MGHCFNPGNIMFNDSKWYFRGDEPMHWIDHLQALYIVGYSMMIIHLFCHCSLFCWSQTHLQVLYIVSNSVAKSNCICLHRVACTLHGIHFRVQPPPRKRRNAAGLCAQLHSCISSLPHTADASKSAHVCDGGCARVYTLWRSTLLVQAGAWLMQGSRDC